MRLWRQIEDRRSLGGIRQTEMDAASLDRMLRRRRRSKTRKGGRRAGRRGKARE